KGIPIAKLSSQVKQQIPSEIIFAKTGGEMIDFSIALSINEEGKNQQTIQTVAGHPLELVVKADKSAKRVVGYIVFKSRKIKESSFNIPSNVFNASLMFDSPALLGEQKEPINTEEILVSAEFEYVDTGDGVWTATVPTPVVDGEYEVVTVMDYEDDKLASKEMRLVTVVDPEGYVYEKDGDKETRISGSIVQLFWLNPETKQYELWPAGDYQQENPQTTDVRGTYSFLVPEGYYYLRVDAPGYMNYDGKPFQVTEGSGIHINIELKTGDWWLKIIDWKTALLAFVIFLLVYNFYKDKIREARGKTHERQVIEREIIEREVRKKIKQETRERKSEMKEIYKLEVAEATDDIQE
ncbi:MAG: carboxypeptidase-like regulatory domain-containing protein, partial [bacterium]|nr:carboxypeptidase-like regulatory domain-containing protein [bacterium]